MNQQLSSIELLIQQSALTDEEKQKLLKEISNAHKQWNILEFKLDRTEKVKKTTTVLLEETIEELEKKRKDIEDQNKELEIQNALEKVRAVAMGMKEPADMLEVCKTIAHQLELLNVKEIRNVQTAIFYENKGTYMNYEYYAKHDKTFITETSYTNNKIHLEFAEKMLKGSGEFMDAHITGDEVKEWIAYQKTTNVFIDDYLNTASSLNYYWYSLGPVALGISTYSPLKEEDINLFRRFLKVFELAYRRYLDIEKALTQAREAKIEAALERVRSRSLAMHTGHELGDVVSVVFEKLKELGVSNDGGVTINILTEGTRDLKIWGAAPNLLEKVQCFFIPYFDHRLLREPWDASDKGLELFTTKYSFEEKNVYYKYVFEHTDFKNLPDEAKDFILNAPCIVQSVGLAKHSSISIYSYEDKMFSDFENDVLKRFAKVFEQAYVRFVDLQKAEAQSRESQIQLALERVRARTMAMQKSDELQEIVTIVFQRLADLDIQINSASVIVLSNETDVMQYWIATDVQQYSTYFKVPFFDSTTIAKDFFKARQSGTNFSKSYTGKEKKEQWNYLFENTDLKNIPADRKKMLLEAKAYTVSLAFTKNTALQLLRYNEELFSENENEIFQRFANVFEQAYIRFLDLQKAEAQVREAQIEASLERVRSKTMAMHSSDDVADTVTTMFNELVKLGIEPMRCGIGIIHDETKMELWTAKPNETGKAELVIGFLDMQIHSLLKGAFNGWKNKKEHYAYLLKDDDLVNYFNAINNYADYPVKYDLATVPATIFHNDFYFREGTLFVFSREELTAETAQVFKRFSAVFGQTYRRYKDLQKAEAQAKEAQIEASLERVRSRAMAMQTSEELAALIGTVFTELTKLDLQLTRCVIWIFDAQTNDATWWMANSEDPENPINCEVPYNAYEPYLIFLEQWKKKTIKFQYELKGKIKKDWDKYLFNKTGLNRLPDFVIAGMKAPEWILLTASFNNFGAVNAASLKPLSDKHTDIMLRFAKVFDLTYTRFNDLKQAEASAREAKIEAALERVRGKAMAMHNSNDLSSTASIVFTELRKLGINPIRCGVGLLNKESRKAQLYSATSSADGDSLALIGWVKLSGHPVLKNIYDTWIKNEEYFPELSGKQLKSYYELLLKGLSVEVPEWQSGQKQYGTFLPFTIGCLYAWSEVPYNEAEIKILKRFANIIDLTFRRYIDLQKSENSAKEAVKQSALDRIRADIASMRTTNDLERITPLIWNELNILGVPFIRCGVFIMNDEQQLIHTFLSTPDGKAIAAFHIPYNTPGNIKHVVSHWRDNKNYIDHWDEDAFTEFAKMLVAQGALASPEQYLKTIPHGGFYLHFLPFLQGMLYVGNTTQLSEDEINLIQSLADAFSTAYARYEDFNKLEAAKKQVDKTLVELKQTQQQLVQSEKMASLGELTAGIAHEIQNPLNFVNNFSEVNEELLIELIEEFDKGNAEEAKAIANDIKQNLEKINHHGKRADAIVKGMLQHSRTTKGVKEPTDINVLCDEYLRLSYHGLRAKDKSFNADFKTEFDETIGKINIIPQDIGRVLLNLFNNAFYAVSEKNQAGLTTFEKLSTPYKPLVSVQTKKLNDEIEIIVSDNGNGIPSSIKEKIFQPFFTTKPTGQGTGLGLSLSYDIITKEHNGTIKVKSKEGEGSKFIIQLPT